MITSSSTPYLLLIDVILPNICKRITHPMYATENNNMTFGDILNPSASLPKKPNGLLFYWPPGAPGNGLLAPPCLADLYAAIFLANSRLSPCSIML